MTITFHLYLDLCLIDEEGKLMDVDFTRPSNKNFEQLLKMYLE